MLGSDGHLLVSRIFDKGLVLWTNPNPNPNPPPSHPSTSRKVHNTKPLTLIGWNTICLCVKRMVVPIVFLAYLGPWADQRDAVFSQTIYRAGSERIVQKGQLKLTLYVLG